jgi:hypothetical protein
VQVFAAAQDHLQAVANQVRSQVLPGRSKIEA